MVAQAVVHGTEPCEIIENVIGERQNHHREVDVACALYEHIGEFVGAFPLEAERGEKQEYNCRDNAASRAQHVVVEQYIIYFRCRFLDYLVHHRAHNAACKSAAKQREKQ